MHQELLDQVRAALRLKHYSIRTEQSYVDWIERFIRFNGDRSPQDMGRAEVQTFLTHLAVEKHVAASTQNQALSALLFLYRRVLDRELDLSQDSLDNLRAKKDKRLPTVLTRDETLRVIGGMKGVHQLMAKLLYGSGLRLTLAPALARQRKCRCGMYPPPRQRSGLCPASNHRARNQRQPGPRHHIAR